MYRFTTPTHTFTFRYDVSNYQEILITYVQKSQIVLEKHKSDLVISEDGKTASFKLTQEESSLFDCPVPVYIQVRVLTDTGDSFASSITECRVDPVLHCGCLPCQ